MAEDRVKKLLAKHKKDKDLTEEIIEPGWDWSKENLIGYKLKNKMLSTFQNKANFQGSHLERADLRNSTLDNALFNNAHLEGGYGLKHRIDCVNVFLSAYGVPKKFLWSFPLPNQPQSKKRYVPDPITANQIINYDFYPDSPLRTLNLQYIHAFNFWFGPRAPKEITLMKLGNINWKYHDLDIVQPKRNYKVRRITESESILFNGGLTRKSLRKYVDDIRPKLTSQYSKDYLFINMQGKPFELRHLGKELGISGRMVDPNYYPYCGRHFCASARLIQCWINDVKDPLNWTKEFMDHELQATTEGYTKQARNMFRKYPFDWIKCTLKKPNRWFEDSALKSNNGKTTFVSCGVSSVDGVWARRDLNS